MTELDKDRVRRLIDGELTWEELRNEILPDPKDTNRFEKVLAVLQERVDWDDPILVPLNDHLYVVGTADGRVVRGACGEDLCTAGENWKRACDVRVREDEAEFDDLYPEYMSVAPDWSFQLREWFCPGCYALVDVDAVPVGYPVVTPFEPDIDTFYEEWQGRPAPDVADGGDGVAD